MSTSSNFQKSKPTNGDPKKSFYFLNTTKSSKRVPVVNETDKSNDQLSTFEPQKASIFSKLFRKSDHPYQPIPDERAWTRKVPIKVEPKVFFANERTFLSWLHMSVTLASISLAIVAFAEANRWSKLYGLVMLPVAITFCGYSLWMYIKRAAMIRRKAPGPYEDKIGPIVLACLMAATIVVNFGVKLFQFAT